MAGVLDGGDVFQLGNDGFDCGTRLVESMKLIPLPKARAQVSTQRHNTEGTN
jgi:hypothetical protein